MIGVNPLLQIDIRKQRPRALVKPPHRFPPVRYPPSRNHGDARNATAFSTACSGCLSKLLARAKGNLLLSKGARAPSWVIELRRMLQTKEGQMISKNSILLVIGAAMVVSAC